MSTQFTQPPQRLGLQPGNQLGAYRVEKRIGAGGMGEVWLAQHALLGRRAAIKVLHPEFSAREDIVTRFFNEAKAATAINDPGIVQIFDFGQHTDGSAYIVMELLDGETLDARCRNTGITPTDALRVIRQVASSLGAAHARGIVHRDLKPENIFLVRDPEVVGGERAKILDFGIAKVSTGAASQTHTAAVMGTPAYMSPEQCRGAGFVDARSDVYALGCVMFAILTGRGPFEAEGMGDFIIMHVTMPPPLLSSRRPNLPPGLDALVARCLEKDPARRFASGTDLAAAIGQLLAQMSQAASSGSGVHPNAYGATMASAPQATPAPVGMTPAPVGMTPAPVGMTPVPAMAMHHAETTLSGSAGASLAPATPAPALPRRTSNRRLAIIGGLVVAGATASVIAIVVTNADETPIATTVPVNDVPKDPVPEPEVPDVRSALVTFAGHTRVSLASEITRASAYAHAGLVSLTTPRSVATTSSHTSSSSKTSGTTRTSGTTGTTSGPIMQPDKATPATGKTDAGKTDETKTVTKIDVTKTDAVKTDATKTDATKTDATKTDPTKTDPTKKPDKKCTLDANGIPNCR